MTREESMRKVIPRLTRCALCPSTEVKPGDALCRTCHANGKTIADIVAAIPPNPDRSVYGATVARELREEVRHVFHRP